MKKILFSVIALTALGMTQAHAETENKSEYSTMTKVHPADAGFRGFAGGRSGGVAFGSTNRIGSTLSSGSRQSVNKEKALNGTHTKPGDLRNDNQEKGNDRNSCSCGGGIDFQQDRLFYREFNIR
ncbi:MAG: hypothetical protein Q4B88_03635 [Moraxella sp.]|nr:hypothetical protein [Moraxella sp.]